MKFLRYPGGKGKLLNFLIQHMPDVENIDGTYIEPFVGGGSVFLHLKPQKAIISDLNLELINLYKGIKNYPHKVWEVFKSFPEGKAAYYQARDQCLLNKKTYYKAARTLYLNRTCFKGMWRHNPQGQFNVGYGGEDRRWVITHENIILLSRIFRNAEICNFDFEKIISSAKSGDFLFLDPPYKPGERDLKEAHYVNGKFSFSEQMRLANSIHKISQKQDIRWALTNSSHPDILKLYKNYNIHIIPIGTGTCPGIMIKNPKEVLITNY